MTLRVNTTSVAVGLYRAVRVTPEGYWLAAEDLMRAREYHKTAAANVKDYDYDAARLYRAGLSSNRYKEHLPLMTLESSTFHR